MRIVALALLACAALACSKASPPPPASQGYDVYVPGAEDAGEDAGTDAGDAAFGVGQVDRAGRPLVAVLLVPQALQDEYNAQPSLAPAPPRVLQAAMESRLVELDTLVIDGGHDPLDWPVVGGATQLLPVLAGDVLLVDTAHTCTSDAGGFASSYFDLERELFLGAAPHTTCGGRTPAENVVDETLALLVTADREGGPVVTQGVSGPTSPASTTFPYLAAPN
jgi:hypothetical protein